MSESNDKFRFECPSCGSPFLIAEQYRGREVKCPRCSTTSIADDNKPAETPAGSTMPCPFCAEEISTNVIRCQHCGSIVRQPGPGPVQGYPQRTSGMAIASLVLGLIPCMCVPSLLAIIFGHIALSKIANSNGQLKGRGMAIAGLILGYFFTAASIIYVIIVAAGTTSEMQGF